jgi:hypothetical protein
MRQQLILTIIGVILSGRTYPSRSWQGALVDVARKSSDTAFAKASATTSLR